ncbi:hypothetical protein FB192DRAFT_1070992 [Mucor lusitanicus]|uniref:Uncharacterized protein n=1 Tax=Mucor circinelloides f. lusitanicus TaxID=29924 RepID=A0A8H4BIV6_MUCCL|nr:hypothetical protein FB192DRAFT_1070992 [Mucor lusitanicus]
MVSRSFLSQRCSLLAQGIYKFGNMGRHHLEHWYQSHVWTMIHKCFGKIHGVEAIIRESASLSSKRRMNQNRTPTAIDSVPRLAYGHKCDPVFRLYDNSFSYGACQDQCPRLA